jgi:DNA-binding transcriptional regulator YhcF (GntR family)
MSDDKTKVDARDRARLNQQELYEIYPEAKKLGVSKEEIIAAINKVGTSRADVESYIRSHSK